MAEYAGFSLHAGTAVEEQQREKIERLARYVRRSGRQGGAVDELVAAERALAKHVAMNWAQRLKRVFAIDIERCRRARLDCGVDRHPGAPRSGQRV